MLDQISLFLDKLVQIFLKLGHTIQRISFDSGSKSVGLMVGEFLKNVILAGRRSITPNTISKGSISKSNPCVNML